MQRLRRRRRPIRHNFSADKLTGDDRRGGAACSRFKGVASMLERQAANNRTNPIKHEQTQVEHAE